ncbi:hypothetical protein [Ancylobacter sp.]|uniref:hypothetical protein n=1 Tax=Ancylobacter sp. TaxID=1872567 RepID=UPI003D13C19D
MAFVGLKVAVAALMLCALHESAVAESYVCIPDMRQGFAFREGHWQAANVTIKDKLLVKATGRGRYEVSEFGVKKPPSECFREGVHVRCGGYIRGFLMNVNTLRFQEFFLQGYVDGDSPHTPFMSIGRCSQLD